MNHTRHDRFDTDRCLSLLNGHPRVKARVAEVGIAALAAAIPTVGERYVGAYNAGRVAAHVARVRAFLCPPGPQVWRIDEPAATQGGRLKAILRREGRLMGDIDLFIAGATVRHGLTVVTNKTSHFERIPELPLEHWLEPPQASASPTFSHSASRPLVQSQFRIF